MLEIILINEIKEHLKNDTRTKMLMTNYSFFSAILEKKLSGSLIGYSGDIQTTTVSPLKANSLTRLIRWFTEHGGGGRPGRLSWSPSMER